MKSETKELVEWITSQVMLASKLDESYKITPSAIDTHRDLEGKTLAFLNSLPEIESHLCRGGFIQDKNGTPCCDGDKILFCGEHNGILRFGFMDESDKKYNCLPHFWFDFGGKLPTINSNSVYFEKVEE